MRRWRLPSYGSPMLGDAMRKSRELRVRPIGAGGWQPSDIYHQMLRMSWRALTASFVISFITFNLVFAFAYSLDPTGVHWGEAPVNAPLYWRAFFFSVDTLATIGYGNMYPVSVYANILVVIEITLGILFFAIVTGIVFARFSRPTARVLFSRIAVVTDVEGTPTLMFRAANLRHNLVFEAHATVSVLMDEELGGTVMRRFKDLKLVRDANPVFTLSWMIMHPIDADSPLVKWVTDREAYANSEIIVVLSGVDDRTGQAIHGRWAYAPSDIRWNERFADIIGRLPDGTRTIDYRLFHSIAPEEAVA